MSGAGAPPPDDELGHDHEAEPGEMPHGGTAARRPTRGTGEGQRHDLASAFSLHPPPNHG